MFVSCQVLMTRMVCEVRALAVLPTKELAQQVRASETLHEDPKVHCQTDRVVFRSTKCSGRTLREPL